MRETGSDPLAPRRLSIRVRADGFSFSVLSGRTELSAWRADTSPGETPAVALARALRDPRLDALRPGEAELVSEAPATLVPLEHFRKGDMAATYRLCYPSTRATATDMQYQLVAPLETAVVFPLDSETLKRAREAYPEARALSREALLLERDARAESGLQDSGEHFYAHAAEDRLMVCSLRGGRLRHAASYEARTDEDRLYYILAAWKAIGLDAERDVCRLPGATRELARAVGRYILKTEPCG